VDGIALINCKVVFSSYLSWATILDFGEPNSPFPIPHSPFPKSDKIKNAASNEDKINEPRNF
jgi:hypothetical protein